MSSSNSKPTRSRYSSPHHLSSSSTGPRGGGNNEGSRSLMQRWLEPPVQNKPSFQEAGLIRGGVVENMAPLGTMPKAAMLKKADTRAESPSTTSASGVKRTRIVLKRPFSIGVAVPAPTPTPAPAPAPSVATPSATATPPETTRMSSNESVGMIEDPSREVSLSPTSHHPLRILVADDRNDDEYVPEKPGKSKGRHISQDPSHTNTSPTAATPTHSRRQFSRHRSVQSSPAPPQKLDPTPDPTAAPTPAPTSPAQSNTPSSHQLVREPDDKDLADKIIECAVDEAIRFHRYPTAWALRLLYDEHSSDPNFVSMMEDIYYQRATAKTSRKFKRMVSEKKKEGKKENKGFAYFVPPSTESRSTPHKPKPAPYENLIKMDFATVLRNSVDDVEADVDGHARKKRKTESVDGRATSFTPFNRVDANINLTASTNHTDLQQNVQNNAQDNAQTDAHNDAKNEKKKDPKKDPKTARPILSLPPHGNIAKNKSPKGKKTHTRSTSVSSTSSLSSVPDDVIEDYDSFMDTVEDDSAVSHKEDEHAEGNNGQIPAVSMQPISAEQAKPAIKKQIVSLNPASQHNTPTQHPRSRDSSMPAAVISTTTIHGPTHHQTDKPISALKFPSRFGDFNASTDTIFQKKLTQKSETTVKTKGVSGQSFVRVPLELDLLPEDPDLIPRFPAPLPEHARLSRTPAPTLTGRAARAAKRNHDDFDDASSPTASSFRADFEPSSARNSRAATPSNPRSTKKPRGGLRVKTSPMKKKGTSAGIPRGPGERPSPVGNGMPGNQDDNDDSCYTCGGNGELVCCDGCTFSFHFMCIDPPMDHGHIPDEWYCNECDARYNQPPVNENRGVFGALTANLQRKNPHAFRLPEAIRDYFEGVKTGAEGEYEEIAPPKPKTNKKNAEESFDFFKVRNADKAVLCHECNRGMADDRPIIPCSLCGLNWHLECLNPPMAVPPVLRTWHCPCHVGDVLADLPARLAPAHKYRKIKNMPVIDQSFSRGLANNGWVEIEQDDEDDEGEELAWREQKSFGRVFRVSAKGIKHDFISRIRRRRGRPDVQRRAVLDPALGVALKPQASLDQQQAALNLLSLYQNQGDGVHQLVNALVSEASPTVLSMMAQGDAQRIASGNLEKVDVVTLQVMLAQVDAMRHGIAKILEGRSKHACREKIDTKLKALTPNSIPHDDSTVVDELKLDPRTSQGTDKYRDNDTKPLQDDSTMQID